MTQPLWFLRHDNTVIGPFPVPQIKEMLDLGAVTPNWEISLNEQDWLTILESGQFELSESDHFREHAEEQRAWLAEREQARKRWRHGEGELEPPLPHDLAQDDKTRLAVSKDQVRTDELVRSAQTQRSSPVIAILALAVLAGIGAMVWFGQQEDTPIETGISLVANCAAPAADGVNWTGCDKQGVDISNAHIHNARMERVRLDAAKLTRADLSYALLKQASLRNADLRGVVLIGADLTGADLTGADLSGADVRYAILAGVAMEGTRLNGARLDKAVWPDGRVCGEGAIGQCP